MKRIFQLNRITINELQYIKFLMSVLNIFYDLKIQQFDKLSLVVINNLETGISFHKSVLETINYKKLMYLKIFLSCLK
jgi:hypothetical protein